MSHVFLLLGYKYGVNVNITKGSGCVKIECNDLEINIWGIESHKCNSKAPTGTIEQGFAICQSNCTRVCKDPPKASKLQNGDIGIYINIIKDEYIPGDMIE